MKNLIAKRIQSKLESIGEELFTTESKILSKRYNLPESIIREYRNAIQSDSQIRFSTERFYMDR